MSPKKTVKFVFAAFSILVQMILVPAILVYNSTKPTTINKSNNQIKVNQLKIKAINQIVKSNKKQRNRVFLHQNKSEGKRIIETQNQF